MKISRQLSTLWKKYLPTSRAKTADGLLAEIQRLILAEPKRYNQDLWVELLPPEKDEFGYVNDTSKFPSCGTIGCVAGWCATLKGSPRTIKRFAEGKLDYDTIYKTAQRVLGLSDPQAEELFASSPENFVGLDKNGYRSLIARPGTKAYARLGYNHIQAFRDKYRAQLRATRLA